MARTAPAKGAAPLGRVDGPALLSAVGAGTALRAPFRLPVWRPASPRVWALRARSGICVSAAALESMSAALPPFDAGTESERGAGSAAGDGVPTASVPFLLCAPYTPSLHTLTHPWSDEARQLRTSLQPADDTGATVVRLRGQGADELGAYAR
jgi:hypothetical protein